MMHICGTRGRIVNDFFVVSLNICLETTRVVSEMMYISTLPTSLYCFYSDLFSILSLYSYFEINDFSDQFPVSFLLGTLWSTPKRLSEKGFRDCGEMLLSLRLFLCCIIEITLANLNLLMLWFCLHGYFYAGSYNFDGLVQERRNSSALAMELCLSCTNLLIDSWINSGGLMLWLCYPVCGMASSQPDEPAGFSGGLGQQAVMLCFD